MNARKPRRIPAILDVLPFKPPPFNLNWVECSFCKNSLELHQPDSQEPEKLLAICVGCRRWFLMLIEPNESEAVLVLLPEGEWLQAATQSLEPPAEADASKA